MRKMLFSDLSTHVQTVFANLCEDGVTPEENYEGFKKLTYDLNHNPNEIYDEDGNKRSKKEAEDSVRKFVFAIMGLTELVEIHRNSGQTKKSFFLLLKSLAIIMTLHSRDWVLENLIQ